jgi:hypothetical protein
MKVSMQNASHISFRNRRAEACFRAERVGGSSIEALTVAMFSGVLTFLGRPGDFLFSANPVALTL